jgi:hypothetical protein
LSWKKKTLRTSLVILLCSVSLLSYLFFKRDLVLKSPQIFSSWLEKKLIALINKNINGKISIKGFELEIDKNRIGFEIRLLRLKDIESNLVSEITDLEVLIKWSALNFWDRASFLKQFRKLSCSHGSLCLVKDGDSRWNLEKVFNLDREKKGKFLVEELDIPALKLTVLDQEKTLIEYDQLKISWFKNYRESVYHLDLASNLLKEVLSAQNYFKIYGKVDSRKKNKAFSKRTKLYLDFKDFNIKDFGFLLDLLPEDYLFFPESFGSGVLNAHLQIGESLGNTNAEKFNTKGFFELKDWNGFSKTKIEAELLVDKDLEIKNFFIEADSNSLNIAGKVSDFESDSPQPELKFDFHKISLREILEKTGPFFKIDFTNFIKSLEEINPGGKAQGVIELRDSLSSPSIQGDFFFLDATKNTQKNKLRFNLSLDDTSIYLRDFLLLLDFSKISLKGYSYFDLSKLDLNFNTEDLSISLLHKLLKGSSLLKAYQNYLDNVSIAGYTNLDIKLKKTRNSKDTNITGTAKLAKINFSHPGYPISFSNITGDLSLNGNNVDIKQLNGYIEDDYIKVKGKVHLIETQMIPDFELSLDSDKLSASNIISSKMLSFFDLEKVFDSFGGNLKNLKLNLAHKKNSFFFDGDCVFENISVSGTNKNLVINKLNGPISFSNEKIESSGLNFFFGLAETQVMGYYINETKHDLDLSTNMINLVKLYSILPNNLKSFFEIKKGLADFNLRLLDRKLTGTGIVKNAELIKIRNKRIPYDFNNFNMDLEIQEDSLILKRFSSLYGLSDFSGSGSIKNLKEPRFDFIIKANLFTEEFESLIPQTASELLGFSGYLPIDLELSGNQRRQKIKIDSKVHNLRSFSFSDWFLLNRDITARLKGTLDLSSNSLTSNDTEILFGKKGQEEEKTKLKANFSVLGLKNKNLNYHVRIETETKNLNLKVLEPNLIHTKPFNLQVDRGDFNCDTFGDMKDRQTICKMYFNQGKAVEFGIGDLSAQNINIELLSFAKKPLDMVFNFQNGNWNGIPYQDLSFDLNIFNNLVKIENLKASILEGRAWAQVDFDLTDESSKFKISGDKLPAHELAQGLWGLGTEVPAGSVSGNFEGISKGIEAEDLFFNLVANSSLVITNGKLSQLKSMNRILTAVSTLKNFDLNNIMNTLVNFQGGVFDYLITALHYDKGKVSTDKILLKAPTIELKASSYADYTKDFIEFSGEGLVPKHSKSFLRYLGLGEANLGNLASIASLNDPRSTEKRYFEFSCAAPVSNSELMAVSLREGFRWKD